MGQPADRKQREGAQRARGVFCHAATGGVHEGEIALSGGEVHACGIAVPLGEERQHRLDHPRVGARGGVGVEVVDRR